MKQNQSHPNDPTQYETCESADIQNNPEIHDAHAYEFTAIASHVTEGKNQAGIKLIPDDGQARTFPLFYIHFTRQGNMQALSYTATVLVAHGRNPIPAVGPITFLLKRRADQSFIAFIASTPDGRQGVMETALIADVNGDEFDIAATEQFGGLPWRDDGYPFLFTCWLDAPMREGCSKRGDS